MRTIHVFSVRLGQTCIQMSDRRPYISPASRFSNLSIGLSTSVSISANISQCYIHEMSGMNPPTSNDCLAMPREASRPAKLPYIPSSSTFYSWKHRRRSIGTWSIESPTGCYVEYFPVNGEKDLATVLAAEGLQRLGRVSFKDRDIWMTCWHPVVPL